MSRNRGSAADAYAAQRTSEKRAEVEARTASYSNGAGHSHGSRCNLRRIALHPLQDRLRRAVLRVVEIHDRDGMKLLTRLGGNCVLPAATPGSGDCRRCTEGLPAVCEHAQRGRSQPVRRDLPRLTGLTLGAEEPDSTFY